MSARSAKSLSRPKILVIKSSNLMLPHFTRQLIGGHIPRRRTHQPRPSHNPPLPPTPLPSLSTVPSDRLRPNPVATCQPHCLCPCPEWPAQLRQSVVLVVGVLDGLVWGGRVMMGTVKQLVVLITVEGVQEKEVCCVPSKGTKMQS